jgi:uncharacterized membrane protein YraQ (UPF0718 family)
MTHAPLMTRRQWLHLAALFGMFLFIYLVPIDHSRVIAAVGEGLHLTRWYAREHVILCLFPALLIASAIGAYVDKAAIIRYLGPGARKSTAYGMGAISGCVLAVCSCTVLPLFAGIYRMGAGLGPATAFLYAGPAINVLAVILTARVLGAELGIGRMIGAVVFSVLIGLAMAFIFERRRNSEDDHARPAMVMPDAPAARPLHQLVLLFAVMIAVLVFANWSSPQQTQGLWYVIHACKWWFSGGSALLLLLTLWKWYAFPWPALAGLAAVTALIVVILPDVPNLAFGVGTAGLCLIMPLAGEPGRQWWRQTWEYAKLITPLLLIGVFAAGVLLGHPGSRGLVPPAWIDNAVGGNGLNANLGASVVGAFMYFATLTEVPILEGLLGSGMGRGPALALLLAGPALSLPNMIVIRSVLGTRRTIVYCIIVIVGSTLAGWLFGALMPIQGV